MSVERFKRIKRVKLATQNSPLVAMENLSKETNKSLFVKRDDLIGVGVGGNKVRKLEYLLADALNKGASSVITGGGIQSNHAAATALCSKRFNLKCHLALIDAVPIASKHYHEGGNIVLDTLSGAEIKRFPAGSATNQCIVDYAEEIRKQTNDIPYTISMGGSDAVGALGYVNTMFELAEQFDPIGVMPDTIIHASGSAGTQAGLIVGATLLGLNVKVLGCSVLHTKDVLNELVLKLCLEIAENLGIKGVEWQSKIFINDEYIGEGYGIPNTATWNAIQTGIQYESIVFDPCYSGKAFNYFLDLASERSSELGNSAVFLHTGGLVGLMGYADNVNHI